MLSAVAASAPNNAWAIGENNSGKAVILRWNGSQWKQVSFSAPAGASLRGVSVTSSAERLRVVGGYGAPPYQMIALRWNGSTWKRVSLPKLPLQAHEGIWLNSVSATSASNAWAVGPSSPSTRAGSRVRPALERGILEPGVLRAG